jgi:uncharacterized membrane protein HdeD (DUF308 family)
MEKSTKTVIIIMGALTILAGIYSYFYKSETTIAYSAIFVGVALIGSVLLIKTQKKEKSGT